MLNADFFLTSLTQKVRILTFSAKADQSGSTVNVLLMIGIISDPFYVILCNLPI